MPTSEKLPARRFSITTGTNPHSIDGKLYTLAAAKKRVAQLERRWTQAPNFYIVHIPIS